MLREAQQRGVQAALAKYRVKEAGPLGKALSFARMALVGELPSVVRQARKGGLRGVFRAPTKGSAGGVLHPGNVLWPTVPGSKAKTWIYRGMSALPALGAVQAMRGKAGDPGESRLTNTLGALGSGAGMMYGGMAGGVIGAPILGRMGHSAGQGLGRLFGGKPKPPALPPAPPPAPRPENLPLAESTPGEYPQEVSAYSRGV